MKCPSCTSATPLQPGSVAHAINVDGRVFAERLAAEVCAACGEAIVSLDELERCEIAVAVEIARTGAAHSGAVMKFMRKVLALRVVELAELLGVAPEDVTQWEADAQAAPQASAAALDAAVLARATKPRTE